MKGKFTFRDLGRQKASFTKEIKSLGEFWNAVGPHFMSDDLAYEIDTEKGEGRIFVGGFRMCGAFSVEGLELEEGE